MNIFVTGDTHGDISHLVTNEMLKNCEEGSYLVICGDFGVIWKKSSFVQDKAFKALDAAPFTTLVVLGNHENFDAIYALPKIFHEDLKAEVYVASEKVFIIPNGSIISLADKKAFVMGGGLSIDKHLRTEGLSWWPQEMPSEKEYEFALSMLHKHNYEVDYVFTHTCSVEIKYELLMELNYDNILGEEELNEFLSYVHKHTTYEKWFFGHWHIDKEIDERTTVLYNTIIKVK